MKLSSYTFIISFIFLGCSEQITPSSDIELIVLNSSKYNLNWVKVYLEDKKNDNATLTQKEIAIFKSVDSGSNSILQNINLKKYSQTGLGSFRIYANVSNTNDTLKTGGGNYKNFVISQEFTKNDWHTIEIILTDLPVDTKPSLFARLALYENGKLVKRYGN